MIDWKSIYGFMMLLVFLPLSFCFGGAFALAVFKYPAVPSKVKRISLNKWTEN
jgi:hypothetical protein